MVRPFEPDHPRRNVLPGDIKLQQHSLNYASHSKGSSLIVDDATEVYQNRVTSYSNE